MSDRVDSLRRRPSLTRYVLLAAVALLGLADLYESLGPLSYLPREVLGREHVIEAIVRAPATALSTVTILAALLATSPVTPYLQGAALALSASAAAGMVASLSYFVTGSTTGPAFAIGLTVFAYRLVVPLAVIAAIILDVRKRPA